MIKVESISIFVVSLSFYPIVFPFSRAQPQSGQLPPRTKAIFKMCSPFVAIAFQQFRMWSAISSICGDIYRWIGRNWIHQVSDKAQKAQTQEAM
jgi:hypothetical protein